MESPPSPNALTEIERSLAQATMRLGRLRARNRGSHLHRELTAVFYDVQAARHEVVRLLGNDDLAGGPPVA
jgi:hypothetical protein